MKLIKSNQLIAPLILYLLKFTLKPLPSLLKDITPTHHNHLSINIITIQSNCLTSPFTRNIFTLNICSPILIYLCYHLIWFIKFRFQLYHSLVQLLSSNDIEVIAFNIRQSINQPII